MLLLSSGLVVDISVTRVKYHALKCHGPAPDARHRALYCLVDVVFRYRDDDGIAKRGWTEYDYTYSGYTLADIHKADNLYKEDITELLSWATQPSQKALIETARRRLVDSQEYLSSKSDSSPRFLYSTLQQRIQVLPLKRARADQWQATIKNLQKSGLRQEEIDWSGLNDFFENQKQSNVISKDQIITAINFNNIHLELSSERIADNNGGLSFIEVAKRMPHQAVYRAALKLDNSCQCLLRYIEHEYNYRVGVIKTQCNSHYMAMNKYWFAFDPYGRAIHNTRNNTKYFSNSEEAKLAANKHASEVMNLCHGTRFNTHYDHLTLYGGDNYREWIVSLPWHQRTFFGAHHFDHNVLLHIRTTTRHDNKGHKLLFIEEVQSDWHQQGQLHGYDKSYWGTIANAPFKKEWPALAIKLMLIRAGNNGFDGIAWPDGDIQETRYSQNLNTIKRRYDKEIPKALNRLGKAFNCQVERTQIETRDPWLTVVKSKNKWRVSDNHGKFETRDKYNSRQEAMSVIHRHCKSIQLGVSVFLLNKPLLHQITETGLPLFGESI